MKDEIKEILDNIKSKYEDYYVQDIVSGNDLKLLSDYITNLQEQLHQASLDIQELTEKDIGCPSWCDKLTNLQEENKVQKKQLESLIVQLELYKDNHNYLNDKIDKAIDKMKDIKYDLDIEPWSIYQVKGNVLFDLLNILQGKSDE